MKKITGIILSIVAVIMLVMVGGFIYAISGVNTESDSTLEQGNNE